MLPYLQPAALTPHVRDLARGHEVGLKELRAAAAAATGTAQPELVPLRRVRPKDVLTMAALIVAAYLVVTQLAAIGFGTIAGELGEANPVWVVIALILAQAAFIGSGISVRGAVPAPLPLLPCVVLQSAIKFINLTVPSSAGRIGMNLRFLQRMGVPRAQALVAGAIDDVSETMIQIALLLLTLPFVGAKVDTSQFGSAEPDTRLVAGIAVALLVSLLLVVFVPKVHDRVVPQTEKRTFGSLGCRSRSAEANRALRRKRRLGADLCARARSDLSRVRRPPERGAACLRQHLSGRPLGPDSGTWRDRGS